MHKYFCIIALACFSCSNPASTDKTADESGTYTKPRTELLKHTAWLVGEWHNVSKDAHSVEMWHMEGDTAQAGVAYFIAGEDTVSSELLRIEQRGDDLFYIATVKDQNNGKPVEFRLTDTSKKQLLFENPAHDFPQKILYTKVSDIYTVIKISGIVNGKNDIREFPMIRKKAE